uniref:Helicase/UvrB N-terminal domain-containing protein n=1 Tax=viral metagenome TaxID=1070528 RepID=A0A6C0AVW0_9ZZZZ|tara:strand:- start:3192 stop:5828 length:2637 start_codon:yes stop_codon:yes gene_type:complete
MDLVQRKLTRDEWNSVEVPVSQDEKNIINLIKNGYNNITIIENYNNSILNYLKIENSDNMDNHLYKTYFMEIVKDHVEKYNLDFDYTINNNSSKIKKIDSLRLEKSNTEVIKKKREEIFDYLLLLIIGKILKYKNSDNKRWNYYYYSLYKIKDYKVKNVNKKVITYVKYIIDLYVNEINLLNMIEKSTELIEKNEFIYTLGDIKLYDHQKQLFTIFKNNTDDNFSPKLVLYIAPTATGKTLSPIGLSEGFRVIFVCAARHVGMSLAKSAISGGKKIALAFGCGSHEDIRLHMFSGSVFAKHEYRNDGTKNKRCMCGKKICDKIGQEFRYKDGSRKMDHSVGDKVEIMICDVQSYICAMYYMCSFNWKANIITYWDEPTITMDYESHPCHETISNNWKENIIPNIVLSSATLPKQEELKHVISDFTNKFINNVKPPQVHTVISHDCKKSIPIINKNGYVELPHYICNNYNSLMSSVEHCKNYLTVLRYFDLHEVSKFIIYICKNSEEYLIDDRYALDNYFESLEDINMSHIKNYYLLLISHIKEDKFEKLYNHFSGSRKYKVKPNTKPVDTPIRKSHSVEQPKKSNDLVRTYSVQGTPTPVPVVQNGALISTRDAHTITDGPAIFIAQDVDKIGKFCIQQANIPSSKMTEITETIVKNNVIKEKIMKLEKLVEDATAKFEDKDNKAGNDNRIPPNVKKMMQEVETLQSMVKSIALDDLYVPNKISHLKKWVETDLYKDTLPYTSDIIDTDVEQIMMLNDIENIWKVLLLLGIGLFSQTKCIAYTEIVKRLATNQKLYLIIANGDYIYGTNYQFCHGFIGKDVEQMTQEKAIQAFGRIGRNKLQQTYTVRLRDDTLVNKIFFEEIDKIEVRNMNLLFNSD